MRVELAFCDSEELVAPHILVTLVFKAQIATHL